MAINNLNCSILSVHKVSILKLVTSMITEAAYLCPFGKGKVP